MSVLFLTQIHIISFTSVTIPPIFQQNERVNEGVREEGREGVSE